jgi:four helix bundle protein
VNVGTTAFRDLKAYRLAVALGDDLYREVAAWTPFDKWSLGMQLVRAADSVGANIAEGVGRSRREDRRRFLVMARSSIYETEHWLLRAHARGLVGQQPQRRIDELVRVLNGLIKWASTSWER